MYIKSLWEAAVDADILLLFTLTKRLINLNLVLIDIPSPAQKSAFIRYQSHY